MSLFTWIMVPAVVLIIAGAAILRRLVRLQTEEEEEDPNVTAVKEGRSV